MPYEYRITEMKPRVPYHRNETTIAKINGNLQELKDIFLEILKLYELIAQSPEKVTR